MKQDPFANVYRALTPKELAEMFMNPNAPKTEAEHWAVREIEKLRAEIERLRAQLNAAVTLLAEWSHAVDDGGASWDCWDTHYKEARWGKGSLRSLIDEEIAKIAKLEGKP